MIKHSIGKVWIEDDHNEWATDISDDGSQAFIRPGKELSTFVPDTLREAVTSYRVLNYTSIATTTVDGTDVKNNKNVTQVELTPHTGRGHQLRLHMAAIGHPIVNDDMHGGGLCLHASNLSIDAWCLEPGTSDEFQICQVNVESPPPFGNVV